ncbi:MAG: S41 family peptidase [Candidatus Saccharimonadales bacterium]
MARSPSNPEPQVAASEKVKARSKKRWPLLKILLSLAATCLVFAGGVEVGRGNLHIQGLSPQIANQNLPSQLNYSSVNQVYNLLRTDFDGSLNTSQLLDGIKSGLVSAAGDPYTEYFNAADAKALNNELAGSITGIGAELGTNSDNDLVVVSPLSGYPADKAGLKPQDIIAAINGQSTQGMSIDTAVTKIRGQVGTKVTLGIIRDGGAPFNVQITRQQITIPSVTYQVDNNIGYIKISQFTNDTVSLSQQAAQNFKSKGVKGVVLDLRGNPGGYLNDAVSISSLWLNKGQVVVSERRGSTIIDTEYATGNNPLYGLPTAVLIDGGSASASEITAGALRDNGVATLVGEKSFGKGSVQEVENLGGGGELKVTIAHWYTPDGKNINKQGITPDVVVGITDAQSKAGQDPQKDKAFSIIQAKISS